MINQTRGAVSQSSVQQATQTAKPVQVAQSGPPPMQSAEVTFKQMLALSPELASAIPERCTTASSKVMYVMTHGLLSKQLKGAPMSMPLGPTGSLSLKSNGSLELNAGDGSKPMRLSNTNDDLARMLDGADKNAPSLPSPYVSAASGGVNKMLDSAVTRFYADPKFNGGADAANTRGQNTFSYKTMPQVLVSSDPSQKGLECLASADFHLYKSMGLIPPDLSRQEVEKRYTSIQGGSAQQQQSGPRIGPEYDLALRGIPSKTPFSPSKAVEFANTLRTSDWAKLTGASDGTYTYKAFSNIQDVAQHLQDGGAAVHTGWADGGHHFVLSGARVENGTMMVNEDDSLTTAQAQQAQRGTWQGKTEFSAAEHSRFWSMVR